MNLAVGGEIEVYELLLMFHLEQMMWKVRHLKPEHWDWTPDVAAPTPRTIAVHAWQWLMCDRQHILEADASKHADVEYPATDPEEFCKQFGAEIENWRELLQGLRPDDLDQPRRQFGNPDTPLNVRFFLWHMVQNVIYKHGQLSELYFALGYDGTDPYSAPFPNEIYGRMRGKR